MSIFSRYFVNIYMIAALAWTAGDAQASSLCSAVQGLQMERLRSWNELKAALNLIETCFSEARAAGGLATEAQKVIIEKCGECISSISELWLEGSSGRQAGEEIARQLYARNNGILKGILDMNNEKVRLLQEQMLDTLQDTSSFFASAAWQDPQYLISLASYWLSWNGYYSGLLLPQDDPKRKELLRKATQGFARTFLDFKEDGIVIKSLFGRALCYKDLGAYDKALLDINSVIARLRREDPLYVRALYEKALISYTTGNYEPARGLLKELEEDVRPDMISRRMRDAIQQMEKKILIAMLEKNAAAQGKASPDDYRDALREIARISGADESKNGDLYRFAAEHAEALAGYSDAELGAVGCLAVADWFFSRKHYEQAADRYKRLSLSGDPAIKKRMDEVWFRLGYCQCQREDWLEASRSFELLFDKFPGSSCREEAACLYYAAAAQAYKQRQNEPIYESYIRAAR